MPFIPHTDEDIASMLSRIGVDSIEQLFDEIPESLRSDGEFSLPDGMGEYELMRHMRERAGHIQNGLCFVGAGAYDHHIPQAVWDICSRGEFLTSYTPYQAEASQGSLQLIYEFQTMIASLMGMDVANASLYEGASALAEAILMAIRLNKKNKSRRVLIPANLPPSYRQTIKTIVANQGIELDEVAFCPRTGRIDQGQLHDQQVEPFAACVIAQPNFFGTIEAVDELTNWVHENDALVIATVNPIAMALFKEPGSWGETGADIACGEGQPLGVPLASGGPYFGFMACRKAYVRQLPGRIVGATTDLDGKRGYTLTLQAREQHIRRSKATSNICTNQGLLVTAATIHMSLLGFSGLQNVATACHQQSKKLFDALVELPGVEAVFEGPFFHERVIRFPKPVVEILAALSEQGIQGGYDLSNDFSQIENSLLICATETRTDDDIARYLDAVKNVL